jgi:hypothetical protein
VNSICFFPDLDMQPDRPIEIDAVVVDEALSFRLIVLPGRNGLTDAVFCVRR